MAAKIKKGDTVVVLAGKRQGPQGEVIKVRPRRRPRAGARRQHGQAPSAPDATHEGGIIAKEAPIHMSNVALADPKDGSRPASASRS